MGEVTTSPKPYAFVLMPFVKGFDDLYKLGIKPACEEAGAYCERVDEQVYEGSMYQRICNQIAKADLLVAVTTGKNENVFYEVGYAHALGKRVFLATRDGSAIPFDVKDFPHIVYGDSISTLKDRLTAWVRWAVEHPVGSPVRTQPGLELWRNGRRLVGGDVVEGETFPYGGGIDYISVGVQLRNGSGRMIAGTIDAGIKRMPGVSVECRHTGQDERDVVLPDGRQLYLAQRQIALPPESWAELLWRLFLPHQPATTGEIPIEVVVYGEVDTLAVPLKLVWTAGKG